FHLQRDLSGPVLLSLARPLKEANKELEKAQGVVASLDRADQRGPHAVSWEEAIEAVLAERAAVRQVEQHQEHLKAARAHVREIGDTYHPFDRQTGKAVAAEEMRVRLGAAVAGVGEGGNAARAGTRARQAVTRAGCWVTSLVGCLAWFWTRVRSHLESLELEAEAEQLCQDKLPGGLYWARASGRAREPGERQRLSGLSERLLKEAWAEDGALGRLSAERRQEVERVARQCVELFQRSSSCVEGRNGRLSLFHHGQTRLSEKRLQALTAVHNYV